MSPKYQSLDSLAMSPASNQTIIHSYKLYVDLLSGKVAPRMWMPQIQNTSNIICKCAMMFIIVQLRKKDSVCQVGK